MRDVTRQMPTVTIHAMRFKRRTQSLLSRTPTTFTPPLALAYVKELSADYLMGAILDARGTLLAGDERLARPAREWASLAGWGDAPSAPAGAGGAGSSGAVGAAGGAGAGEA